LLAAKIARKARAAAPGRHDDRVHRTGRQTFRVDLRAGVWERAL